MSEQQSIRDEMRRDVSRAVMLGAGLAKPAWTTVPVDDREPTGEMKSIASTDVTPFVIFVTDVILASPAIRRIQAEALRSAAEKMRPWLMGDGSLWEPTGDHTVRIHGRPDEWLPIEADRIERAASDV